MKLNLQPRSPSGQLRMLGDYENSGRILRSSASSAFMLQGSQCVSAFSSESTAGGSIATQCHYVAACGGHVPLVYPNFSIKKRQVLKQKLPARIFHVRGGRGGGGRQIPEPKTLGSIVNDAFARF